MTTGEVGRRGKVVISGGRLIDGCGNPWVRADVGIADGLITEIAPPGRLRGEAAHGARLIEAEDRYVTPGFIDPHTHSDLGILQVRAAEGILRQGVTTHVAGNCGLSAAPLPRGRRDEIMTHVWEIVGAPVDWESFDEYLAAIEQGGAGINIAALVGHGTLRVAAMGAEPRTPSDLEMAEMKRLLAESLDAGAFGLSTGLVYPPGCYAQTAEIIELAKVVAARGGVYTSHIRGERETILDAVREAVRIGEEAGLPVEISHNAPKWGGPSAAANLAAIVAARASGVDVTLDNDTHTDLAPMLSSGLPQPVFDLGRDGIVALLTDAERRETLKQQIVADELPGAGYCGLLKHGRFDRIVILSARDESLVGSSVAEIARRRSADPLDTYLDLIVEDDRIVAIFDYIEAADVDAVLAHPLTMVSSDGGVSALPAPEAPANDYSPCSYGEYARVLERYVKERALLSLEDAVRKMSSYPAQRFGLWDRGALRPGLRADVAVFDLDAVRDRATNEYPHSHPFENIPPRYAEGMDYVIVNGVLAIDDGRATGDLAGRALRRSRAGRAGA